MEGARCRMDISFRIRAGGDWVGSVPELLGGSTADKMGEGAVRQRT
jgi:hypothetical protein